MSKIYLPCALVVFAALFATSALAQTRQRVGSLICDADARVGLVLGSRQDMRCVFRSSADEKQHSYRGKIRRVGVDIGVTRGGTLTWAVFAPGAAVAPGALRGSYFGVSGNAALGVGLGAKVLMGGLRRAIALQPLSIEGQIGINLAVAVSSLTLR